MILSYPSSLTSIVTHHADKYNLSQPHNNIKIHKEQFIGRINRISWNHMITPFHKNRIQRRTSLMHATLDEAAKNGFQFYQ